MEITSFILGVCAVIVLLMVAGTSVNYMTIKVIKGQIDNLERGLENISMDLLNKTSNLESQIIRETNSLEEGFLKNYEGIHRTIDSRVDKLDGRFRQDVESLIRELNILQQEISRVERNKDERINY
jgi:hypothetical protein